MQINVVGATWASGYAKRTYLFLDSKLDGGSDSKFFDESINMNTLT